MAVFWVPVVFEFKAPAPNAVFDDIAPAPLPTRTPDRVASVVEEIAPVTARPVEPGDAEPPTPSPCVIATCPALVISRVTEALSAVLN